MPPFIQWVLFLFGLWLMFLSVRGLREKNRSLSRALAARSWPAATGTILLAKIEKGHYHDKKSGNTIHTYRPEVSYRYRVGDKEFTGTRLAFGKILYYQPAEAEAFLAARPAGASVRVYHDPANPAESVLDRGPSHAQQAIGAEVALFVLGLGAVAACLWSMQGK
jgi:hypothetical protein